MINKGFRSIEIMKEKTENRNGVSIKSLITKTKGAAKEYCEWALTIYEGCDFGCSYCYARKIAARFNLNFPADPKPREGLLEALKIAAPRYKGKQIFLSFMSDSYPAAERVLKVTRQAIEILLAAGCSVKVLTKAGRLPVRDFDLLSQDRGSMFGVTLTEALRFQKMNALLFKDVLFSEPGASDPEKRLYALMTAHAIGIRTFVSFEPVVDPSAVFYFIEHIKDFTDEIYVGKWNNDPGAKSIDWQDFTIDVVHALEAAGYVDKRVDPSADKVYYIKNSLQEYLPE